jgi:hypothetical protein
MNPYLERDEVWQDFHQSFIPLVREVLTAQVRPAFVVKVEEYLFIHELSAEERRLLGRADVGVRPGRETALSAGHGTILEAPVRGRLPEAVDVERHSYLEIRSREGHELVTVLELLSPSNKRPGPDREQYLAKRRQLIASPVHMVEIDLLCGGPRLPVEGLGDCDYYVMVSRAEERPEVGLWPLRLPDPLPPIRVPLRPPHADARLDLQEVLHRLYAAAGYEDYIYAGEPQPPLQGETAAWAELVLRSGGRG